jgi:hypothetical protein
MNARRAPIRSFNDVADQLHSSEAIEGICLDEQDFAPEFFDLRSGLAGELFQKFANYQFRLAIVLRDPAKYGERFAELVFEHRRHTAIRFFGSEEEARLWLRQPA